jgi:hypothetical protein
MIRPEAGAAEYAGIVAPKESYPRGLFAGLREVNSNAEISSISLSLSVREAGLGKSLAENLPGIDEDEDEDDPANGR